MTRPRRNGSTTRWRRIRLEVLARDPVCSVCHLNPSTVAGHITPYARGGSDSLDNLRGECKPCSDSGGADIANGTDLDPSPKINTRW